MDAEPERQRCGILAVEAKLIGPVEPSWVTVRSAEHDGEVLALPDRLPRDRDVLQRSARIGVDRGVEPQQLLHGVRPQLGVPANELPLVGMARERDEGVADRARRRLVSGQQQDRQQADQLGASDVPLGFSGRERGDEIVSRLGSPLVGQLAVVGGDLFARLVDLRRDRRRRRCRGLAAGWQTSRSPTATDLRAPR